MKRETNPHAAARPRRPLRALAAALLLLPASACLVKETRHTLYLEPGGSLGWTVIDRDVRSDTTDRDAREREEREFLDQARSGRHPSARALDGLWPRRLDSVVLRERRPFTVYTEARFEDVARMTERGLRELDLRGEVRLHSGPGWMRWTVELDADDLRQWDDAEELPELLVFLLDHDRLEIRLTEGEFLDARGFEIRDRGTLAVPAELDPDEAREAGGKVVLSLTWSTGAP